MFGYFKLPVPISVQSFGKLVFKESMNNVQLLPSLQRTCLPLQAVTPSPDVLASSAILDCLLDNYRMVFQKSLGFLLEKQNGLEISKF